MRFVLKGYSQATSWQKLDRQEILLLSLSQSLYCGSSMKDTNNFAIFSSEEAFTVFKSLKIKSGFVDRRVCLTNYVTDFKRAWPLGGVGCILSRQEPSSAIRMGKWEPLLFQVNYELINCPPSPRLFPYPAGARLTLSLVSLYFRLSV